MKIIFFFLAIVLRPFSNSNVTLHWQLVRRKNLWFMHDINKGYFCHYEKIEILGTWVVDWDQLWMYHLQISENKESFYIYANKKGNRVMLDQKTTNQLGLISSNFGLIEPRTLSLNHYSFSSNVTSEVFKFIIICPVMDVQRSI